MIDELNPNHPVTREFSEQWHKLCAILILKQGVRRIEITSADVGMLANREGFAITMRSKGDVITLELVNNAEAARLARKEGGLPV